MWQGLSGLRENLGKGLQEFSKEALRESSTLIREVSKVRPALIKEAVHTTVANDEQQEEPPAPFDEAPRIADVVDDGRLRTNHEAWNSVWEEGEPKDENPSEVSPQRLPVEGHAAATETTDTSPSPSMNGVAEEGSFVELDIHASHTNAEEVADEEMDASLSDSRLPLDGAGATNVAQLAYALGGEEFPKGHRGSVLGDPAFGGETPVAVAVVAQRLSEVTGQRDQLAERLDAMEDELEAAKAHQASLEAALQAARTESAVAGEERNQAEAKATRQEMEASAAKKKQEALEGKVKMMAGGLEQRMQGLMQQLESRTSELAVAQAEVAEARGAFDEVKGMLEECAADRDRLGGDLEQARAQLQQAREDAAKYKQEADGARREIAESVAELAEARADLWATKEAAKGNALGEDERASLEAALKAVSASAQTAASEAGAWKVRAEAAEEQVASLTASLAAAEAAVSAREQRVLEAELAAQEAARAANQAQLSSAEVKEQSEQRSRIFRAAVKAAVGKIQTELEGERDAEQERVQHLEAELKDHAQRLQEAEGSLESVSTQLASLQASSREEREAAATQSERLESALRKLGEAEDEVRVQRRQAEAARDVAAQLTNKMSSAESEYSEQRALAAKASQQRAWAEQRLTAETERLSKAVQEAERERDNIKSAASEASSRSAEEVASCRARIAELEGKLAVVESRALRMTEEARVRGERSRSGTAAGPARSASSGLEDLGLEGVRWKDSDEWQSTSEARVRKAVKRGSGQRSSDKGSWFSQWGRDAEQEAGSRGKISKRTAVVLLYLFILHIMVMVSFTSRASPALCIDLAQQAEQHQLPG